MRLLPLFSMALLLGCNADRVAQLEKQNKELTAKVESMSKAASLDLKGECAAGAESYFRQRWGTHGPGTITLDYTNLAVVVII